MRTCHLIDSTADPGVSGVCPTRLAALADFIAADKADRHVVCALGSRHLLNAAESVGLRVDQHIAAPDGRFWSAWWALRRRMKLLSGVDVMHAWSLSGAALLALVAPNLPRIATVGRVTLTDTRARRTIRLLRRRALELLTFDTASRNALIALGADADRVHAIDPPIDASRIERDDRRAMHMRWGVSDDAERIVAVIGDPAESVNGMLGMLGVGLCWETHRPVRGLMGPHVSGLHRAVRVARGVGRANRLIITDAAHEPWRVLGASDAALVMGGRTSLAWAMTAGLPIITPADAADADLLEDRGNCLIAPQASAGDLARELCRAIDDTQLSQRIAHAAAERARVRFSPASFAQRMRKIYEDLAAGRAVSVPAHESANALAPARRADTA